MFWAFMKGQRNMANSPFQLHFFFKKKKVRQQFLPFCFFFVLPTASALGYAKKIVREATPSCKRKTDHFNQQRTAYPIHETD
jgi:hypothetical protein